MIARPMGTAAGSKNSDTPLSGTHYVSAKMYGVSIFLPAFAAYGQGKNGIAFFQVYLGKVYQARHGISFMSRYPRGYTAWNRVY